LTFLRITEGRLERQPVVVVGVRVAS
jgi:hypothetical protein